MYYCAIQDARKNLCDSKLDQVAMNLDAIKERIATRFKHERQKLRGHLAKVYAMHWADVSR